MILEVASNSISLRYAKSEELGKELKRSGHHPLTELIVNCLQEDPNKRATAKQLLELLTQGKSLTSPVEVVSFSSSSLKISEIGNWGKQEVRKWLLSLELSKDYSEMINENEVDGETLRISDMKDLLYLEFLPKDAEKILKILQHKN